MAQVEIQRQDSKLVRVASDATWKTLPSPISPIGDWAVPGYGGESCDWRLQRSNWWDSEAGWEPVAIFTPHVQVSAEMIEPDTVIETFPPIAIKAIGHGVYRIDMGRNYAGWAQVAKLKGKPGQKVTVQFAERPNQVETYGRDTSASWTTRGKAGSANATTMPVGRLDHDWRR